MRAAIDHMIRQGQLRGWGIPTMGVLVETLLDRGADGDVAEAEAAIERLAAAPAEEGLAMRDIWLLRLRALLARAHGDAPAYAHFSDRYRDKARSLGFEDISRGPKRCHDGRPFNTLSLVCQSPYSLRTKVLSFSNVATKLKFHAKRSPCQRHVNSDPGAASEF